MQPQISQNWQCWITPSDQIHWTDAICIRRTVCMRKFSPGNTFQSLKHQSRNGARSTPSTMRRRVKVFSIQTKSLVDDAHTLALQYHYGFLAAHWILHQPCRVFSSACELHQGQRCIDDTAEKRSVDVICICRLPASPSSSLPSPYDRGDHEGNLRDYAID